MEDLLDFMESDLTAGYVSLPTGSGKTVLFSELINQAQPERTLIVVPRIQLLVQTQKELAKAGVKNVSVVSSHNFESKRGNVSICTYASFVKHLRARGGSSIIDPNMYDLLILDEAHHALAEGARESISKFSNAKKIGFSATPDYSDEAEGSLSSILPTVIHKVSVQEAIDLKLVTPFVNVLLQTGTDLSGVPINKDGEYDKKFLDSAIDQSTRNKLVANFFAEAFKTKKTVFSCGGIKHSEHMAEELQFHGVEARAVHSKMAKDEIESVLKQFSDGRITAICNNRLLTEGFDEPTVEMVVNVTPTRSLVRQPQRVGRGMRLDPASPGKELIVLDCIDEHYRAWPLFMFDKRLAEKTGLESMNNASRHTIEHAQIIAKKLGYLFLDNDEQISTLPTGKASKYTGKSTSKKKSEDEFNEPSAHSSNQKFDVSLLRALERNLPKEGWRDQALCLQIDSEIFFPDKGVSTRDAKNVCRTCEVIEDCLSTALGFKERYGVWGGLSERERRIMLKQAKVALEY